MLPPPAPAPTDWILAVDPVEHAGRQALEELGSTRGRARVLLTGPGLAWLAAPEALARLRHVAGELTLCSGSAREQGLDAARTPPGVAWSSLARWLVDVGERPFGVLLP